MHRLLLLRRLGLLLLGGAKLRRQGQAPGQIHSLDESAGAGARLADVSGGMTAFHAAAEGRMLRIRDVLDRPFSLEAGSEMEVLLDMRVGLADRQGGESLALLIEQSEKALDVAMQSDGKVYLYKVRPFG